MAAAVISELHLDQIRRWCQQRIPASLEDEIQVEHRVRGRTVTIVERRPPWSPALGSEWTTMPIAQLRYAPPPPAGGRWRLYWADRNHRWHLMDDVAPAATPARCWLNWTPTRRGSSGADPAAARGISRGPGRGTSRPW
jgi:hypothetical protein